MILTDVFVRWYSHIPFNEWMLKFVMRLEGGQFRSGTLRAVLASHYGVRVGYHSYGSLLVPGRSDRLTDIGRYVSVGPDVRRIGAAHPLERISLHPYYYNPNLGHVDESHDVERTSCWVGHDSWIGASVVILPRCSRIGIGSVIGAGSVVNSDIPDFAVAAGVPARVIRYRFDDATQHRILASEYWNLDPEDAAEVLSSLEEYGFDGVADGSL